MDRAGRLDLIAVCNLTDGKCRLMGTKLCLPAWICAICSSLAPSLGQEIAVSNESAAVEEMVIQDRAYFRSVLAADRFASDLFGDIDDKKFLLAFETSLNASAYLRGEIPLDSTRAPDVTSPYSIYRNPTFIDNLKKLISAASEEIRLTGRTRFRIRHGYPTLSFPDCVAVGSKSHWCCSGTLVAPNVVVSAGHCEKLEDCSSWVYFGADVCTPGQTARVVARHVHEDYSTPDDRTKNDLMVLILEHDMNSIVPRRFATTEMFERAGSVRLVGFGNTDAAGTLGYGLRRFVDVGIVSWSCEQPKVQRDFGCFPDLEFVAGKKGLDKDSCTGDSGGPAYVLDGDEWYLAGAVSRGTRCQPPKSDCPTCGDGAVYERIDRFAEWIRAIPGGHWPSD